MTKAKYHLVGLQDALGDSQTPLRPDRSRVDAVVNAISSLTAEISTRPNRLIGTKTDLQRALGVSPGTLDQALRVLQARGQVQLRPGPGGGIFASEPSAALRLNHLVLDLKNEAVKVADSLAVRAALEPLIMTEACLYRGKNDCKELAALGKRLAESVNSAHAYLSCNWAFHRRVAQISPNPVLRTMYIALLDFAEERLRDVHPAENEGRISDTDVGVHDRMLAAIIEGDLEEARASAADHYNLMQREPAPGETPQSRRRG
jgi:GntR family transcriptional regulator, transcriptional repressor for pyruvate dehydrogenase complex